MFKKLNVLCVDKALICMILFSVLSALTVGYIFYNSSQNSKVSNEKSSAVVEEIKPIVDPKDQIEEKDFNEFIRKAAHFFEFSVFGFFLGGLMASIYKKTNRVLISLPLLLSLSVAVLDEFIQSFTGRTSKVMDILIDFGGAITGLLLILLSLLVIRLIRRKCTVC
ncbi:MAG: VanZ family protein [Ruminococcaceae bacterium]|nr:VanZ family protein [Oscillospiraceae bacterium]